MVLRCEEISMFVWFVRQKMKTKRGEDAQGSR
jgi:hypothetical protein